MIGLGLTTARIVAKYSTPGPPDPANEGYIDFHNGIYFPSTAMMDGVSPYGSQYAATYPVARQIPFFSPSIVALHLPLALLPLSVAEVVYMLIMIGLIVAIAIQSLTSSGLERRLDWLMIIVVVIIFSRAGHVTLFNGYFTFELVLATILAVRYASERPLLAAVALVIVSAKPTYILPLGFLMLARGNFKSLAYGAMFSIVAAAIPLGWLAWHEGQGNIGHGLTEIRQQISDAQEVHHNEANEIPALTWTRVDLLAIVAKWSESDPSDLAHLGLMFLILAVPMAIIYLLRTRGMDDGVAGIMGALIMASMTVSLYRQSYDVLLFAPPMVGAIAARTGGWKKLHLWHRISIASAMLFPAYNYLSTNLVLDKLDLSPAMFRLATSINAVLMVVLFVWISAVAYRLCARQRTSLQTNKIPLQV
jgi:hypothetical protein